MVEPATGFTVSWISSSHIAAKFLYFFFRYKNYTYLHVWTVWLLLKVVSPFSTTVFFMVIRHLSNLFSCYPFISSHFFQLGVVSDSFSFVAADVSCVIYAICFGRTVFFWDLTLHPVAEWRNIRTLGILKIFLLSTIETLCNGDC